MPVIHVPSDYPTIALAVANSAPGDTILVSDSYAGNETVTITVENLTISAPAAVGGIDLILGAGISSITLGGASNIDVTGNGLDNTIIGNAGDNRLDGGGGQDRYHGLAGNDVFVGGGGVDKDIADYRLDARTVVLWALSPINPLPTFRVGSLPTP
ncbi:calcium-binding protein [Mesorhizobium sp. AaZ16]|uniref:calcium-binding protein n=1 Tax=Mesorhizobium sp. AaZ16 TaxID=3402289 RepID=UPI00374E4B2E